MPRWEFIPVSFVYGAITAVRNVMFDKNILPSKKYTIPIIGIGNLSMGGTGKSPHTIYIVNELKSQFKIAVISRGYGRLTKGMRVANYESTYQDIGDEPLQIFERFKNRIIVIVSEIRTKAIDYAIDKFKCNLVVLDDCFQHRYVNPGLKILLTAYGHLYSEDYILPVGNLRESRNSAQRADVVIVTKCPLAISNEEKEAIKEQLQLSPHQKLYFSSIEYSQKIVNRSSEIHLSELENYEVVLVTGIANNQPLIDFLMPQVKHLYILSFKDHHKYKEKDIEHIYTQLQTIKGDKLILTTEKDFMRLRKYSKLENYLYYLPIETHIHEKESFHQTLENYVTTTH